MGIVSSGHLGGVIIPLILYHIDPRPEIYLFITDFVLLNALVLIANFWQPWRVEPVLPVSIKQ
jgi:hypothetical protein